MKATEKIQKTGGARMFDASFSFVIVLISHIVLFIRCMSVESFL